MKTGGCNSIHDSARHDSLFIPDSGRNTESLWAKYFPENPKATYKPSRGLLDGDADLSDAAILRMPNVDIRCGLAGILGD